MKSDLTHPGQEELLVRVKALMLLRVLVVTGFIGAIIAFQRKLELPNIIPVSVLIALTYFLTLIYAVALKWVKNLKLFCYLQISADVILEGGVIYITGGIDSPFSILFNFSIISASIILSKKGGYIIASLAAITFGTLLDLEYYGALSPIHLYPPSPMSEFGGYVFNIIYLNFCAFFIIAFLSGFLEEKLRRTHIELAEKSGSLMELQTFHENVVYHMGNGLLTTSTNWVITSFNHAAQKITGYSGEEIKGKSFEEFFPFIEKKFSRSQQNEIDFPKRIEGRICKKDGIMIDVGVNLSVLKDESDYLKGFIAVFQDLTYVKSMERKLAQAELLAAIGQMSASLAHEIRNPLASLSGSIQVLREELHLNGANERLMDIVMEETDRLNQIITQFLDYANPKPPRLSETKIIGLIENTTTLLKNSREFNEKIEVKTFYERRDFTCLTDAKQIKQVLWNLFLNGVQAMPEGGCLSIKATEWHPDSSSKNAYFFFFDKDFHAQNTQAMLRIDIKDEGLGISEENKRKVFEPFFTTKEGGTGLGLATVYRIIENHKGVIEVENNESRGTIFSIFLPLQHSFSD